MTISTKEMLHSGIGGAILGALLSNAGIGIGVSPWFWIIAIFVAVFYWTKPSNN